MKTTKFFKGIIIMLGILLMAIQTETFVPAVTIITMLCSGATYYVKNYFYPSVSQEGQLTWQDVFSALILALATAISNSMGEYIMNGVIDWIVLGKLCASTVLTYITTTFYQGSNLIKKAA